MAREPVSGPQANLSGYSMPEKEEIELARSAAPPSISADASVMVLGQNGYTTAISGKNGFLCIVERSWGNSTTDPEFRNPKVRGPICFNPAAAKTFAPIYLMKTELVLAGKTRQEIAKALALAFRKKELPALGAGAMCYMMSKQQYLGDDPVTARRWHPHLMFFVSENARGDWGADLPGSPVISTKDPEERATIFMVRIGRWSDGTPASQAAG
ncbi:MAG: hypothetical protein OJF61_000679 [Rhodanobacteraceae bacterium]|jgi:hypothetical protein|nr:MAG: hypothetical protein OJF61_000679 [Rhodanobacteraceae bacterium]